MFCKICSGTGFQTREKVVDGMTLSFSSKCQCEYVRDSGEDFSRQPMDVKLTIISALQKLGYKGEPVKALKGLANAGLRAEYESQSKRLELERKGG